MKKFRKGMPIVTPNKLIAELKAGNWIFLRNKPVHSQILMHMTLGTMLVLLEGNLLRKAVPKFCYDVSKEKTE